MRPIDPARASVRRLLNTHLEPAMPNESSDAATCDQEKGFSRRGFLRGAGMTAVAAVAESRFIAAAKAADEAAQADAQKPLGPGAVPITLSINGQTKTLHVEPRTTL